MGDLVITWSPHSEAVSYKVEIEHQVSHETDSQTAPGTAVSATFYNKPAGVYNYRGLAILPDDSTQIVIVDTIEV